MYNLGKLLLIILVLAFALFSLFRAATKISGQGDMSDPERPRELAGLHALADGKSVVRVPVLGYFRGARAGANGELAFPADSTIKWRMRKWRMSDAGFTVV